MTPHTFTAQDKAYYTQRALDFFDGGYACSQAVLLAFAKDFGLDEQTAKRISATFGGGMGRLREKCGALTGAFMGLGLAFGNSDPLDMKTKLAAYKRVRDLDATINDSLGCTNCADILKKYVKSTDDVTQRKHHQIICRRVVTETTQALYDILAEAGEKNAGSETNSIPKP